MKHNSWMRIACFMLALCLTLALVPFTAAAAEEEEERQGVVDFVLLIDCSQTMAENDPDDLVKEACELFVRLLPVEDARLSIIAFGYEGSAYKYTSFDVNKNKYYNDEAYVHIVSQMEGNLNVKRRDEISNAITAVGKNKGTLTPIGAALAAGVDTLLSSNSTDGQACIVLMTDGDRTSGELGEDNRLTSEALAQAAAHEWPIYCIELDYNDSNEKAGSSARKLLNTIVTESGAGADGRKKVSNPDEVSKAFMEITNAFWGGNDIVSELVLGADGEIAQDITVEPFTSELNIAISGGIDQVQLQSTNAGVDKSFSKTEMVGEEGSVGNIIVTKEGGITCIKLICPKSGQWTITVKGDPNAEIDWYVGSVMEMNLDMTTAASREGILTKNDYITVNSYFTYHGVDIRDEPAYANLPAKLVVKNLDTGKVLTETMVADKDGYSYTLNMQDAPGSGRLQISVVIEHGMFRSGSVSSTSRVYELENLLAYLNNPNETLTLNSYVNNLFDTIDLNNVVTNPDGDELSYQFNCVSDRNTAFAFEPDDNGYVTIPTGMIPGTYDMELVVWEEGMTQDQYLRQPVRLVVEDRAITALPIPDQSLLAEPVNFLFVQQDATKEYANLELDSYFTDPDGVELTYGDVTCDTTGLVSAAIQNGVLNIQALEAGETVITFSVYDGVSTKTAQVNVKVTDGPKLALVTYGPAVLAVVGGILAVLLIAWSVYMKRGVKGQWDVSIYENDLEMFTWQDVSLGKNISGRNKHKLLVCEIVSKVCDMTEGLEHVISKYFSGNGAEKILLDCVYLGKGCVLTGLPANGDNGVVVRVNNSTVTKKEKFNRSGSVISVEITDGMDQLRVDLKLH